jgi:pimeloyl-ACP methyl ester carboxylesterase
VAVYVLVHGAWHGGWCYRRVADRLIAAGHRVFTPTLTGLGERAHLLAPGVNLSTHIQDIVNVLKWEELRDVILVGHSYGGFVISGVVERAPQAIGALVYLDAFVPENGQSLLDYSPPERRRLLEEGARASGGLSIPPIPAAVFAVNEKDRAWVDAQCVPQPFAAMTEKVVLTGARDRIRKKMYIRAAAYPQPAFQGWYEKLKADPGWRSVQLPCGHDIMVDMPEELAALLLELA